MAAVTLREGQSFDSAVAFKHVEKFLPAYARPRFVRIQVRDILTVSVFGFGASFNPPCNNLLYCVWLQSSLDVTGTLKYMKTKLVKEGFDPNQVTDPLYFLDDRAKDYVPLTLDIFSSVTSGKIKI